MAALQEKNVETDVSFIEKLKRNDEQALQHFYVENFRSVEQYVLRNHGSSADAKDIYQEAFIVVWRSIQLDKFKSLPNGSINNYLLRIAKNKWLDVLRQRKRINSLVLPDQYATEEIEANETDITEEEINRLKTAFKNLGTQCRDVLTKFYFKKQSMKEIAEAYQWTEATAKNNKYRCIQKLRMMIQKNN